jgi:hypothetical protein
MTPYKGTEPNDPVDSAYNENIVVPGKRLGLMRDQGRECLFMPFKAEAIDITTPASDDHVSGVAAWNMGGNDKYSTCGPTSVSNYVTMVYQYLLGQAITVADADVFALYRAAGNPGFDPATGADDNGVDMVTLLNAWSDVGINVTHADGSQENVKPVAFGAVSVSIDSIRTTTAVFGGAILAVQLDTAQQAQTASGLWDYSASGVWGGHAIMGCAYSGQPTGRDEEIITWAEPVGLSDAFVANQLEQAFAVVLTAHLTHPAFLAGVNVQQLASDYQELTGDSFPAS